MPNKVLEVPRVYILPSNITNFPIKSVISNILKRDSSEHSIAWQLFPDYSIIAFALHLKRQDGLGILRSSASAGSQVESSMFSQLLGKHHYFQGDLHWVGDSHASFFGITPLKLTWLYRPSNPMCNPSPGRGLIKSNHKTQHHNVSIICV